MADKAVLTVALCCAGAVIGYMIGSRMKKRMKYFTDIDDFLRGFIGSLDCSMDTVPEIMAAHPVGSELLKAQLDACRRSIGDGSPLHLTQGFLTKAEFALVSDTLSGLGGLAGDGERKNAENKRRKLEEFGKRAAEKYAKLGKPSVKLGFLAGLLISVLCW